MIEPEPRIRHDDALYRVIGQADMLHPNDGAPTRERLDIAAAQLAILLAAQNNMPLDALDNLGNRIAAHKQVHDPHNRSDQATTMSRLLSSREREFLEPARLVVNLIYQASRNSNHINQRNQTTANPISPSEQWH